MGLFPKWSEQQEKEFKEKQEYRKKVIADSEFVYLTGDFYQLQNWFFDKYKYMACYTKDGKIYGYWQVLGMLGLEEDNNKYCTPPDYEEWETKRKELLEKSGRPYWLITDRDK